MDPYLTPADRMRAEANARESWSDRCDGHAEDYERAGRFDKAQDEYRRSAIHLRDAARILRDAATVDGGSQADLDRADLLTRAATYTDGWAAGLTG
jgi:hypothetical protein